MRAYQACFDSAGASSCNVSGSFGQLSVVQESGAALPAFMTLDNLNGRVTVAPTTGSQNGIYRLEATWTSVDLNIADPKYVALVVTVTCTITSFTRPTPSSSPIAITLFEKTLNYDFS